MRLREDDQDRGYCGCVKPAGCYGFGGWHFYRVTRAWIAEHVRAMRALERATDKKGGFERGEGAGRMFVLYIDEADFWEDYGERYLGTERAYEPCPAYRSVVRAGAARKAGTRSAGNDRSLE